MAPIHSRDKLMENQLQKGALISGTSINVCINVAPLNLPLPLQPRPTRHEEPAKLMSL